MQEPSFTVGIEEEYLLVDRQTLDLAVDPPKALFEACKAALPDRVSSEFLRCQIEIGTPVCESIARVRQELRNLRGTIAREADAFDLAPIAASTHPFAEWTKQTHTDAERYNDLARDMQVVANRLLICGMHVHVGIEDEAVRIDLFNQLTYFLPHLLALSTSSPFWRGRKSGLKSYRLAVFHELPRTGLPETFDSPAEYHRTIDTLVSAGILEDATKVWWDLRPSDRFPTLEMRITDVCTRLDDAIAIAAVFRCLCRMLYRLRTHNQRWRQYARFLIAENRWQAQRHGTHAKLVDFGRGECIAFPQLIDELLDLIREDADHFGCTAAIEHARAIAHEGTSADRQLAIYDKARADGAEEDEALKAIVAHLIPETIAGCN